MTQEEKELLVKALCGYLPYGVKCHFKYGSAEGDVTLSCIDNGVARFEYGWYGRFHVSIDEDYIKPYLRPMSSMTLGEFKGLRSICSHANFIQTNNHDWIVRIGDSDYGMISRVDKSSRFINWLNANHFDYHGLIPMGLALKAPYGMYNTKNE